MKIPKDKTLRILSHYNATVFSLKVRSNISDTILKAFREHHYENVSLYSHVKSINIVQEFFCFFNTWNP